MTGLGTWLARQALRHPEVDVLFDRFCKHLLDSGIPLWRCSLGLEVIHPETSGSQIRWIAEKSEREETLRPRGEWGDEYVKGPVSIVDETDKPYRRRLEGPIADMPILEELRLQGATDYFITPLPFVDRSRSAYLSYATREEGGFTDAHVASLERATLLFSPYAERHVLQRIGLDLLTTYIGPRSAERVYAGTISRGESELISAVICMADMRGFTRYVDTQELSTVLATLNDFFAVLVDAIVAQGGEVLKFMGDAVLAGFAQAGDNLSSACHSAIAAARQIETGIAGLNTARIAAGRQPLAFGLALHAGDVAYGNIGGRTRLDFTVIGPAVNHTARLLELTKTAQHPILMSEVFARTSGLSLVALGHRRLRDVPGTQNIYTLPG
ncbi:adenylate/guanylate cyclase domain-containing protein [soil metagenome]